MALSVTYTGATYRIIVPQADLTPVSGSLYELDTDAFWDELKLWEASEIGIVFEDMQSHNAEYTVAGVTYAPKVEILNASNSSNTDVYEVFFSPDTQYSVRLTGSNNNIFDLQNAILANTTTQVIPGNSAGLIIHTSGSGLSEAQDNKLTAIDSTVGILMKFARNKIITDPVAGTYTVYDDDDSVLYVGNLWENASGTTAYRGQGAERRDRLA